MQYKKPIASRLHLKCRFSAEIKGFALNGIQEVSGSIPLISTKPWDEKALKTLCFQGFFLFLVKT
jgi:hypothetical protein